MSNTQQWWPAPAKLNLFLHITGQRADGYHLLQTVFQFLDYSDQIAFDVRDDGRVCRVSGLADVAEQDDLVVRAARLLQQEANVSLGVDIHLDKNLPVGGGLGGGSSDAATVLLVLNQLWQAGLSMAQLAELGLTLGADVPVFVQGHAAWAEGVGEQLVPVDLSEPWYLVIIPPCQVATARIFTDPGLTRDCHPITIEGFLSGQASNVCEPVVRNAFCEVAEAMDWLAKFAHIAQGKCQMSGTGACVFSAFANADTAREVYQQLPQGWRGFVAKGMNHSPLLEMLQAG